MEAFAIPDARDRLREAVDTLVGESIDGFSTHALGQDIVDIRRAIDRLEAESIRRLHRFHRERGAQADGGGSTVSWLRRACGMTVKAAATASTWPGPWESCRPRSTALVPGAPPSAT